MIYLGTSLVYKYLDSLNINDLPRPTLAYLGSNGDNSNEYLLLMVMTSYTVSYTVLKRPNKVETAVHGCNLAFSFDSIVSLPR